MCRSCCSAVRCNREIALLPFAARAMFYLFIDRHNIRKVARHGSLPPPSGDQIRPSSLGSHQPALGERSENPRTHDPGNRSNNSTRQIRATRASFWKGRTRAGPRCGAFLQMELEHRLPFVGAPRRAGMNTVAIVGHHALDPIISYASLPPTADCEPAHRTHRLRPCH